MNTKAKIGLVVLVVLLLSTLSGCILIDANNIKGDWSLSSVDGTFTFDSAGKITYTLGTYAYSANYTIGGATVTISSADVLLATVVDGTYALETPTGKEMKWNGWSRQYSFTKK